MDIKEIIFFLLKDHPHLWVRYYIKDEKLQTQNLVNELIEIRASFISGNSIKCLYENGFFIDRITTTKINADIYTDITFERDIDNSKPY